MVQARILRDLMTKTPKDYFLIAGVAQKIGRSRDCQITVLYDFKESVYNERTIYYARSVSKYAGTIIQDPNRAVRLYRPGGKRASRDEAKESSKIHLICLEEIPKVKPFLEEMDKEVENLLEMIANQRSTTEIERKIREIQNVQQELFPYSINPGQTEYVNDGSLIIFGWNYQFRLLERTGVDMRAKDSQEGRFRSDETQEIKSKNLFRNPHS